MTPTDRAARMADLALKGFKHKNNIGSSQFFYEKERELAMEKEGKSAVSGESSGVARPARAAKVVGFSERNERELQQYVAECENGEFDVNDPYVCNEHERIAFRKYARELGPEVFLQRWIDNRVISTRKMLTAFNFYVPKELRDKPDNDPGLRNVLKIAITRELKKRVKLNQFNTVEDAVNLISQAKNIIVITGAGISTSLGIPDFRSKDGLYAKYAHLGLEDPQEIFSLRKFRQDPSIFFKVARDIIPAEEKENGRYSPTHQFIAMMQSRGKLLTNYTQNIEGIENAVGIKEEKLVQCHGHFLTATCQKCGHKVDGKETFEDIRNGIIPRCEKCAVEIVARRKEENKNNGGVAGVVVPEKAKVMKMKGPAWEMTKNNSRRKFDEMDEGAEEQDHDSDGEYGAAKKKKKKKHNDNGGVKANNNKRRKITVVVKGKTTKKDSRLTTKEEDDITSVPSSSSTSTSSSLSASSHFTYTPGFELPGILKPDITFFGEALPTSFHEHVLRDKSTVDLVIVIGTSLKVSPVSDVIPYMPPNIPQLYISREPVGHVHFDVDMLGDCDVVVAELCRRLQWEELAEHEMVPQGQRVQVGRVSGYDSRFTFEQVRP